MYHEDSIKYGNIGNSLWGDQTGDYVCILVCLMKTDLAVHQTVFHHSYSSDTYNRKPIISIIFLQYTHSFL